MFDLTKITEKGIDTTLGVVGRIHDTLNEAGSDSLIQYTGVTRVEPVTLVDQQLANYENTTEILQAVLSIFSGYYSQAIAIANNVGAIDVIKTLDKLNPKRSVLSSGGMLIEDAASLALEASYKYKLPRVSNEDVFEDMKKRKDDSLPDNSKDKKLEYRDTPKGVKTDKQIIEMSQSAANLSIGHLLNVNFKSNGNEASIPVQIRLIVSLIGSQRLASMITNVSQDKSVKERYYAWRSGQLSFIKDLIFCNDLVDAHRENLIKDSSGVYNEIHSRKNKNFLSSLLSRTPSVATASNILVITTETLKEIERNLGGSIKYEKIRQNLFKNSYLMLMVIVDRTYEDITIWHRGISLPTQLQVRQVKSANKRGGTDITEVLKAYQKLSAPRY